MPVAPLATHFQPLPLAAGLPPLPARTKPSGRRSATVAAPLVVALDAAAVTVTVASSRTGGLALGSGATTAFPLLPATTAPPALVPSTRHCIALPSSAPVRV